MRNQHTCFTLLIAILLIMTAPIAAADDYFDRITVFSDGKITRFTQMPIRVHIAPMSVGVEGVEAYLADLRYAMREWDAASDGQVHFREAKSLDEADLRVRWQ